MPRISKTFPHTLGQEEAAKRLKSAIAREKINKAFAVSEPSENWIDDYHLNYSMKVFSYPISGDLAINDSDIVVNIELPVVAVMVTGMIEDQLQQQMKEFLA
ncbi:MAG: polyhydroxyalkanoic acid system family protein [Planctomycetia bacterium]|nr:polyhydroxyalkanoic acid system family protein [Planctomycetia bacterium]